MAARRKILHLCPIAPARAGNGLAMRVGMFLEALGRLGDVDVVVIANAPEERGALGFAKGTANRILYFDARSSQDGLFRLAKGLGETEDGLKAFAAYGKPSMCATISSPVMGAVCQDLGSQRYDFTVVSRAHMLPALDPLRRTIEPGKLIVDLDDDDETLCREMANRLGSLGNSVKARWLEQEATAYSRLIDAGCEHADLVVLAGQPSLTSIGAEARFSRSAIVPNAIEIQDPVKPVKEPELLFVGNLAYEPNRSGIVWFMERVLPLIREKIPTVSLTVAGANPSPSLRQTCAQSETKLVANPDNLDKIYASAALVVVPLLMGSGTRIKILEAGAFGLPVVSTLKGAEGLNLDQLHVWLTNENEAEFADQCAEALASQTMRQEKSRYLRKYVKLNHDRSDAVENLSKLLDQLP